MARHAAIGSVMLRVGLTLCALMLLDAAAQRMSFPRGRRKLPAAGAAQLSPSYFHPSRHPVFDFEPL
jgi:hypothetical protein